MGVPELIIVFIIHPLGVDFTFHILFFMVDGCVYLIAGS